MRNKRAKPEIGAILIFTDHCNDGFYVLAMNDWHSKDTIVGEFAIYLGDYKQIGGQVTNHMPNWIAIMHPVHGPGIVDFDTLDVA